ncbi:MAG: tRNA (adenine-N1)-methyltransferase [Anaerolineales bacterium]|nr:tRNA (adenine-N1)-methyltransferase [Anaerolineales bacterium]
MRIAEVGDLAMLQLPNNKQTIFKLEADLEYQTHKGSIHHNDLIGSPWGRVVETHLGASFLFIPPTLHDLLRNTRRSSQIIFPKDIGYILLRLSIGPGTRVLEAGTGSGALTTAFAWMVGDHGKVISYDRRKDMQDLSKQNLERVDLAERVDFFLQDIAEGIGEKDLDAVFLDLPKPELYLSQIYEALANGGVLGTIVPTTNQVATYLSNIEKEDFDSVDVAEILLRFYKPVAERLRPTDRMIAHTGYLIFARRMHTK